MVEWFRALVSQSGGPGFKASTLSLAGQGAGGTPLNGLYRYVRPQRVWFFSRFGHKKVIYFSCFWPFWSVINRVWFLYSSFDMGMFQIREATFSSLSKRKSTKALHKLCLR